MGQSEPQRFHEVSYCPLSGAGDTGTLSCTESTLPMFELLMRYFLTPKRTHIAQGQKMENTWQIARCETPCSHTVDVSNDHHFSL